MSEMKLSQEEFEYIESYLEGSLSTEETNKLADRTKIDQDFKLAVDSVMDARNSVLLDGMKKALVISHDELEKTKSNGLYKFRSIAAVLIIAIGLGFWYFNSMSLNEELYTEYYKEDPGLKVSMGAADNVQFMDGMIDFRAGDYNAANAKWIELKESCNPCDSVNYYLGMTELALNNHDKAANYLRKVDNSSSFINSADWYRFLIALKKNDQKELSLLSIDSTSKYFSKSEAIRQKLSK